MVHQVDVYECLVDLLLLVLSLSLELEEDLKMLLRGKGIEKDVMLRTDAQDLAELVHVAKDIDAESLCLACCPLEEAGQDGNSCCLACPIMAQEGEDLTFVHG